MATKDSDFTWITFKDYNIDFRIEVGENVSIISGTIFIRNTRRANIDKVLSHGRRTRTVN